MPEAPEFIDGTPHGLLSAAKIHMSFGGPASDFPAAGAGAQAGAAGGPVEDVPAGEGKRRRKAMTWDEFKTSTRAAFEPENIKHSFQDFGQKTKAAFEKLGDKMGIKKKEGHSKRGYANANASFPQGYDPETETFEVEYMSKGDKDKVFMRGYTEADLKDPAKCGEILKLLDKKRK